jgi:hypothetical protein
MTPEQCRAARAWLNPTQADLAKKAKVGLSTVIEFEHRYRAARIENRTAIQTALERQGIRFVHHSGTLVITFVKPSREKRAKAKRGGSRPRSEHRLIEPGRSWRNDRTMSADPAARQLNSKEKPRQVSRRGEVGGRGTTCGAARLPKPRISCSLQPAEQ